jgi:hypothetical protein
LEVAAKRWMRSFDAPDRVADPARNRLAGALDAVGSSAWSAAEAIRGGELVDEGVELKAGPGRRVSVAAPVGVVDVGLQLADPALVLDASPVVDDGITRAVLAVKTVSLGCLADLDKARVAGLASARKGSRQPAVGPQDRDGADGCVAVPFERGRRRPGRVVHLPASVVGLAGGQAVEIGRHRLRA